jgi:colanic acid biosynthesis glycosyl transferase WcaI
MKILVMVCSFPPEISAGHLEYELSQALTKIGHAVSVVTAFPRRYLVNRIQKHKGKFVYTEKMNAVEVKRMGPEFANRDNLVARGLEYFVDFVIFGIGGLLSKRSDVILCSSPPMTIGLAGWLLARIRKIPIVLRIGDIHPQALIDLGLVKSRLVISILKIMERLLYQKVDHIIVLSEKYRQDLIRKGTDPAKISVVPNWVDSGEVAHLEKVNTFRKNAELSKDFLVTYAGIMSWPQDLETIVESASLLASHGDIKFLLVGDGPQKKFLESKSKELELKNLVFLPLQPRKAYLNIIQASDVCLVSLKKDFKTPAVPSKLLDIMACGRPVLANVPFEGDVPKIIKIAGCGMWVEPQNPKEVARVVLDLYNGQELRQAMGENARKYFESHFSLESCMRSYEKIFFEAINKRLCIKSLSYLTCDLKHEHCI